ncbi:hypothetical protein DCAR_0208039 [Daucus carota subsp. sativus]|uniref:CLAVATA3/ESR-related protein n=1 Tax=Daucus carota subsp. sativus TaxID=79200 RepID=A0AAF0WFP7_DAUCS|nr:hypothetical protein DCAR_0208039 [Daucus carota subsp. sativus]
MGNGGGLGFFRALFAILILLGFVLSLAGGMIESSVKSETNWINLSESEAGGLKQMKVIDHTLAKKLQVPGPNSDFNFNMNKRRVPNGPDPIHNRKAGNSGRPPGQA